MSDLDWSVHLRTWLPGFLPERHVCVCAASVNAKCGVPENGPVAPELGHPTVWAIDLERDAAAASACGCVCDVRLQVRGLQL